MCGALKRKLLGQDLPPQDIPNGVGFWFVQLSPEAACAAGIAATKRGICCPTCVRAGHRPSSAEKRGDGQRNPEFLPMPREQGLSVNS
jgi:hypothetical protein